MLKTCWECVAGTANRSQEENGGSYGIHLNGNSQGMWPNSRPIGKMYNLAKDLSANDEVIVSLTVDNLDDYEFNVSLMTTNREEACRLEVKYNGIEDRITINNMPVPDRSTEVVIETTLTVIFKVRNDTELDIDIGAANLTPERLMLDKSIQSIRYLKVEGVSKVNSLTFEFDKE